MTDGTPFDEKPTLSPGEGPFARHVFVCVAGGTCPTQGGEAVHAAMKALAQDRLGPAAVRVNNQVQPANDPAPRPEDN